MQRAHPGGLFVLMNVTLGLDIEHDALAMGGHGIFYENDTLQTFQRGLDAILSGELWFSRQVLSQLVIKTHSTGKPEGKVLYNLTQREREILLHIATGRTNDEIAYNLHISSYTVKTHVTNIYSKIKVPNRTQAVLWAAKNL